MHGSRGATRTVWRFCLTAGLCGVSLLGAASPTRAQDDLEPGPEDAVPSYEPARPEPPPPTAPAEPVAPPAPAAPSPAAAPTVPAAPVATVPTARPAINSSAMSALERMSTYLRSLQELEVQSETTTDDILASGQKVQYGGKAKLRIQRPDRMAAEVVTDRKNEQMYYDGTTFTVYQPKVAYYASFAAPPDLRGLVDVLEKRYGIDLPLADLFRWGTDTGQVAAIQRATYLGKSEVKGKRCSHYAFHQADIDWEVWIQDGDQPVPLKLAITTLGERTQPQHVDVMTWNLDPKPDPLAFTFTPPPNAQRISFDTAGAPAPPMRQGRASSTRKGPTR
jgi:hypothetical protein